jgi:hypothetical protein
MPACERTDNSLQSFSIVVIPLTILRHLHLFHLQTRPLSMSIRRPARLLFIEIPILLVSHRYRIATRRLGEVNLVIINRLIRSPP